MTKKMKLSVFPDGNWEHDTDPIPEDVIISIPSGGMDLIKQVRQWVVENYAISQMEIISNLFKFHLRNEDGSEYEGAQMQTIGSVCVDKSGFYFRLGTKHCYDYIMTETVCFGSDDIYRDAFSVHWDIGCIIEYNDINVTTETARAILAKMREADVAGKAVGFDDLEGYLSRVQNLPDEYYDVADELDINQFFSPCNVTYVDTRTLIFFEVLERLMARPENMNEMISIAEAALEECGDGYTIIEAVDVAELQLS